MQRFENTDKPLSSLTGVRQLIHYDDNSTTVKLQSKKKLESLNDLLLTRQYSIQKTNEIKKELNIILINKLKKVLGTRFKLTNDDYIILIDKYDLKNTVLSRKNILEMIEYLNIRNKYTDDNNSDSAIRPNDISILKNSNDIKIIPNEYKPPVLYLDDKNDKNNGDFDSRLQKLLDSRKEYSNVNNLNNENMTNKNTINENMTNKNMTNENSKKYVSDNYITDNQNTNIPNIDYSKLIEEYSNKPVPTEKPVSNIKLNIESIETQQDIDKVNTDTDSSYAIKDSLEKIVENLTKIPNHQKTNSSEINIMTNLIVNSSTSNTITSEFSVLLDYNEKNSIKNIESIELLSCFVNENFYKKNDFKQSPYFIMKIKEFKNNLYLNGSKVGGFCQILWEKKGNYYSYINNDKIFGIFKPNPDFVLERLTIEIYDHKGKKLDKIKSTENDQFNITLKILIDNQ